MARTDAEAATLLDSNIDSRDHPFILGATVPGSASLQGVIDSSQGANPAEIEREWTAKARPMTFGEAVVEKIRALPVNEARKQQMTKMWESSNPFALSNAAAHRVADSIFGEKQSVYFDWEACRVREGYYRIKPGVEYCIQRARAYAPHSDLIWMETG